MDHSPLTPTEHSSYLTSSEKKIYDVLYSLDDMIKSESKTHHFTVNPYSFYQFNAKLSELAGLNEKYLGKSKYDKLISSCVSTAFLEDLIHHETTLLNRNEAIEYKSTVLNLWDEYMRVKFLPYLVTPILILKKHNIENDDKELSAIMRFIRLQWDILYGGCPYGLGPRDYNVLSFC